MTDDNTTLPLSDVTLERARMENDSIDEQFSDLEAKVDTLEDEKADIEDELADVRDERDQLQEVVAQYRDARHEELLTDLRATVEAAAVDADDLDVDFSELEDADINTLETVKNTVETTIEAAGLGGDNTVSNRGNSPDITTVENEGNSGDDVSEAARAAAADLGMADAWDKVESGERLATGPQSLDVGDDGTSGEDIKQELAALVKEASN